MLAEHSRRAGPTAKAKRTSQILDVPEADPERMETLAARSLRPWKQDPTERIRFGLPTTFPEGDVPVTIEIELGLAIDPKFSTLSPSTMPMKIGGKRR